jgi:hypothetical protein
MLWQQAATRNPTVIPFWIWKMKRLNRRFRRYRSVALSAELLAAVSIVGVIMPTRHGALAGLN